MTSAGAPSPTIRCTMCQIIRHIINQITCIMRMCRSRRSAPPKAAPGSGPKAGGGSYWDRVDWDAPQSPLPLPDKWYVRVAWAVLLVGVTLYANTHLPPSG